MNKKNYRAKMRLNNLLWHDANDQAKLVGRGKLSSSKLLNLALKTQKMLDQLVC